MSKYLAKNSLDEFVVSLLGRPPWWTDNLRLDRLNGFDAQRREVHTDCSGFPSRIACVSEA